jgi:hypothetical protein
LDAPPSELLENDKLEEKRARDPTRMWKARSQSTELILDWRQPPPGARRLRAGRRFTTCRTIERRRERGRWQSVDPRGPVAARSTERGIRNAWSRDELGRGSGGSDRAEWRHGTSRHVAGSRRAGEETLAFRFEKLGLEGQAESAS